MAKIDALSKYRNQLLSVFNVQQLAEMKRANWSGILEQTDQLYATMYHDWDVLQKDSNDLAEAVQTLEWTVAPYVADGEEATPEAQEVAKVVTDALWKRTPQGLGSYSHTFTQLIGSLVHGLFRGFNVHEIEWKNDGNMVYPAAFHQLPAQYMRWEDRAGHPDKLLFVADGETAEPKPFPSHKYIVGLNTSGPDHPIYNAMYYSLVAWFGAYKFGLGWFMEYCQKYGIPKLVFHYESPSDRKQLEKDLAEERVLNNILLKGDRSVDIANAPASGASLPQRELLNLAESACHKLILGQTLTSDTSDHGGSLAQAKVHAGVQADIVKKRADYVADVLNSQLIPAIVLLNYGKLDVPMPELRCKIPQAGVTLERVQVVKTALEIQGMKLKKSEVYEFTGFAQPAEGDDVFEAAAAGDDAMGGFASLLGATEGKQGDKPGPDDDPDKPKKKAPAPKVEEDAEPVSAANAEEVDAANPYGCNQYGEGWREPHNGRASKPGKPVKKTDPVKREMPKLIGSKKQIEWAERIREQMLLWASSERKDLLSRITTAKWFIDNRDEYVSIEDLKKDVEKDEEAAAEEREEIQRRKERDRSWREYERKVRSGQIKPFDPDGKLSREPDYLYSSKTDAPTDPAQEWIAPIKEKFLEARKNGASMAELQRMILTLHPRTKALAEAFAKNILAGFRGEEKEEGVAAANPWGCNQYGHRKGHKGGESKKKESDDVYDFDNMEPDERLQQAIDDLGEVDEEDINWDDYDKAQEVKKIFHPDNHKVAQWRKERMIKEVDNRVTDALHHLSNVNKAQRDFRNPNRPTDEDVNRAEEAFGKAVHEWRRFHRARLEVQGWDKKAIDGYLSRWPEYMETSKAEEAQNDEGYTGQSLLPEVDG